MPRIVEEPSRRRPAYFWWLLANVLALCFAVISWALCLHVFGHPDLPRNYEILRKIGRLPHLKRYTALDAPNGSALDPTRLYGKFFALPGDAQARCNAQLLRNYLTNFSQPQALTYIEGDYQVEKVRLLGGSDVLVSGFAVRARAMVKSDDFTQAVPYPVVIEYLLPTADTSAACNFRPGQLLTVKKSTQCAAIVHVERLEERGEQVVCLTVVPLAYGASRLGDSSTITLEPPVEVRLAAGFPVFKP